MINAIDPIFTRIVLLIREGNGVLVPIAHVYPIYIYILFLVMHIRNAVGYVSILEVLVLCIWG